MNKIIIATTNKGKISEFKHIFSEIEDKLLFLDKSNNIEEPAEDGDSYEENALIKASYYHSHFNTPVISDDSGIEIEDLDNKPGIYSSRFLKQINKDGQFFDLYKMLVEKVGSKKTYPVKFISCLIYKDKNITKSFISTKNLLISFPPKSSNGSFGYNPLLRANKNGLTFGEMHISERLPYSPRCSAGKDLMSFLNKLLHE